MGKCQAASGCVRPKHRRMSRRRGRRVARARDRRASEAARRRVKCSSQGPTATLKGKLTEKVRYRPTTAIEPLLPVGSESLETLPVVRPGACCRTIWCDRGADRGRDGRVYCVAIRRTAAAFSRNHVKKRTLAEQDTYTV